MPPQSTDTDRQKSVDKSLRQKCTTHEHWCYPPAQQQQAEYCYIMAVRVIHVFKVTGKTSEMSDVNK